MAENGKKSSYKEQKADKPKVEDGINNYLKDNKKQDAVEFVDYIKSLKMTPQWASTNSWALSYKSKRVGYIKINDKTGDWELWLYALYDDSFNEFVSKESADVKDYFSNNRPVRELEKA